MLHTFYITFLNGKILSIFLPFSNKSGLANCAYLF